MHATTVLLDVRMFFPSLRCYLLVTKKASYNALVGLAHVVRGAVTQGRGYDFRGSVARAVYTHGLTHSQRQPDPSLQDTHAQYAWGELMDARASERRLPTIDFLRIAQATSALSREVA